MIIYRIYHKLTQKSYVGQTTHDTFNGRYSGGRWWAITDNPLLRAAATKHGTAAFEVEILASSVETLSELNRLEEEYAQRFNAYKPHGYNLRGCGNNKRLLPHQIDMIRTQKSKTYRLRYVATWEEIEVFNLKQFCRDKGIGYGSMCNMVNGNLGIIVSQGYCLAERSREEVEDRCCRSWRGKRFDIIHESGERATVTNVKRFARERELQSGSLYKLLKGDMLYYKGWRLPERLNEPLATEVSFELIDPKGQRHTGIGITRFCRAHGLRIGCINKVLGGYNRSHKGWRKPNT